MVKRQWYEDIYAIHRENVSLEYGFCDQSNYWIYYADPDKDFRVHGILEVSGSQFEILMAYPYDYRQEAALNQIRVYPVKPSIDEIMNSIAPEDRMDIPVRKDTEGMLYIDTIGFNEMLKEKMYKTFIYETKGGGDVLMIVREWLKTVIAKINRKTEAGKVDNAEAAIQSKETTRKNNKTDSVYNGYVRNRRGKYIDYAINENCNGAVISDRAYKQILSQTLAVCDGNAKNGVETGGVLVGHFVDGLWYVVESIDQGVKTVNQKAYFEFDKEYVDHQVEYLSKLYKYPLTIVGIWHRHPGSMDYFSDTDDRTIAENVDMSRKGILSMLVNIDPAYRNTFYYCGKDGTYMKVPFVVGDEYFIKDLLEYADCMELSNKYGGVDIKLPKMSSPDGFVHSLAEREARNKGIEYKQDTPPEQGHETVAVKEEDDRVASGMTQEELTKLITDIVKQVIAEGAYEEETHKNETTENGGENNE